MSFLTASAFLKALGWALVNSLWQFAIVWLLYRIVTLKTKSFTAAVKHSIALLLLFAGTIFFIAELSWKFYNIPLFTSATVANLGIENTSLYNQWNSAGNLIDSFMPYWSLLYLGCIVLLFVKLCFFVRRAGSLQNNGVSKMDASWRIYLNNIAAQLGIQKEVKAFLSVHIDTPQVIGFLKPVILIPAACLTNLSTEQLEAVLLHELVHIKRNDYFINLFVASIEILFFFNPFVKQITASIRKEREYSCDDMVIQFKYHPANYASALLVLEKNRLVPVTYGIAASGKNQKQLLTRIERIVGIKNKQTGLYRAGAGVIVLLLLGLMATIHPAKTNFDSFGPAGNFASDNLQNTDVNKESNSQPVFKNLLMLDNKIKTIIITGTKQPDSHQQPKLKRVNFTVVNDESTAATTSSENNISDVQVLNATSSETRDFSLPQTENVQIPEAPDAAAAEPYVPSNSFSYQVTQDTMMPKVKGETYTERKAREAMVNTQKALAEINWQKIEKSLKVSKQSLARLKKELVLQIQNLDWQKINGDAQMQLTQNQVKQLKTVLTQEQMMKQYQESEAYYEAIQKKLTQQAEVIKLSDQRMLENQKSAEQQQKKLQTEMKKRRIIYL